MKLKTISPLAETPTEVILIYKGIGSGECLFASVTLVEFVAKSSMQVFFHLSCTHIVHVSEPAVRTVTVRDGLALVTEEEGVSSMFDLVPYFEGQPLDLDLPLTSLADLSTVKVTRRLRGGFTPKKPQRVGRVKAVTPVVSRKEGPKSRTGRAKKRQLYNKRFLGTSTGHTLNTQTWV